MVIATPNELNFEMDVTILISMGTGIVASEDERPEYLLDSADGISLKIGVDHAGFNPDNWKYKNDYLLIIEEFNEDGLKNNYFYFESTKLDSVLKFAVRNYKKIATAKCSPSDDFLDLPDRGKVYGRGHQKMYEDISAFFFKSIAYPVDK